jgi:hypothetical protein
VAAMSDKFSALYRKPWINLTYDGFVESTNLTRINNFAEILRFCSQERNFSPSMGGIRAKATSL